MVAVRTKKKLTARAPRCLNATPPMRRASPNASVAIE